MFSEKKRKTFQQALKFLVFSGTAAGTNIGLRFVFSHWGMQYIPAVSTSYFAGMIINFMLNRNFNFPRSDRRFIQEVKTFIIIALIGLILTNIISGVSNILIQKMGLFSFQLSETVSHVIAVGIVSIYSFFAHKYITYRGGLRDVYMKMLEQMKLNKK